MTEAADQSRRDRAAITRVIRDETVAFRRCDLEAWSRYFVQDDRVRDVYASPLTGLNVFAGWAEVRGHMERTFATRGAVTMRDFGQENLAIHLAGDVAWVVFDGWATFATGERDSTFQTRILERDGANWRIVYSSFVQTISLRTAAESVALDAAGRLVWAPDGALDALAGHPWLAVSAGHLRGRRRGWDKALQAAIREAGRRHDFFQTYIAALDLGGTARYPVILGHTDEGGVAVLMVSIRNGMTYVEIGPGDDLDRRIGFARQVFGLSEGQTRVARRIAQGCGLKDLAGELGITVNTARTHLSRLCEKTGVKSQTALVRILLSIG